jgi:hypothetical protein
LAAKLRELGVDPDRLTWNFAMFVSRVFPGGRSALGW